MLICYERGGIFMALIIELKVVPQSGRQDLVLDKSGILKCFVNSPPEDGKANKEVMQLIAEKLKIKRHQVEIVGGLTSRKKKLAIDTLLSYEQFLQNLGLVHQKTMFSDK